MSELTCEIDGKFFEGVPLPEDADSPCQGCAGGDDNPDLCSQLLDCYAKHNIIWIATAGLKKEQPND